MYLCIVLCIYFIIDIVFPLEDFIKITFKQILFRECDSFDPESWSHLVQVGYMNDFSLID